MDLQKLQIGDKINYNGITVKIVDWKCLIEPLVSGRYGRIWAEPIVQKENGQRFLLSYAWWNEVTEP